jgi:hypothetical protein
MGTPVAARLFNHSPKQANFQHIKAAVQILDAKPGWDEKHAHSIRLVFCALIRRLLFGA